MLFRTCGSKHPRSRPLRAVINDRDDEQAPAARRLHSRAHVIDCLRLAEIAGRQPVGEHHEDPAAFGALGQIERGGADGIAVLIAVAGGDLRHGVDAAAADLFLVKILDDAVLHGVRAAVKGDDLRIGDALERLLEHGRRGQRREELGVPVADAGAHAAAAVDEQVKRRLPLRRRRLAAKDVLGIERNFPQLPLRERAGALAGAALTLLAQELIEPVVQRLRPLGKRGRQPPITRRDIRLRERQTGVTVGQALPLAGIEPGGTRSRNMQLLLERALVRERLRRPAREGAEGRSRLHRSTVRERRRLRQENLYPAEPKARRERRAPPSSRSRAATCRLSRKRCTATSGTRRNT